MRTRNPLVTLGRFLVILAVAAAEWGAWLVGRRPVADHLHRVVVRLGPTFIKLAQIASTRPDLVPPAVAERLRDLQEGVPPFPSDQAQALVEAELGRPIREAFRHFEHVPVASASLAQVHFAELPDGTPVAVKVQRPGIAPVIERDLAILRRLAWCAGLVSRTARKLRIVAAVEEFGRWTRRELDFAAEGHNAEAFRRNFEGWDDVVFPAVYWSHTTPRVLTMQRVDGLRVFEVPQAAGPAAARRLAKRLAELEMKMFITDGFFHADLHPGNIFFQPDGRIAVLDLGMVGRMTAAQRDRFLAYWLAISRRQRARAFHHLLQMAASTAGADLPGFRSAYETILDRFYDRDLSERSLAQTYLEVVVSGARYGVTFPPELVLQAKAVVTAEALDLVLAPDFRFTEEVRPILARELAERATPRQLLDRLWGALPDWVLLGETPPADEAPSGDEPDEAAFRRWSKRALAAAWTDAADANLSDLQGAVARVTSADHWQARPERRQFVQVGLALLRLLEVGRHRLEQEAALDPADTAPTPSQLPAATPEDRWDAFRHAARGDGAAVPTLAHLETLVGRYADSTFWETRHEDRAAFISALSVLRFLNAQAGQALREEVEHEATE